MNIWNVENIHCTEISQEKKKQTFVMARVSLKYGKWQGTMANDREVG